MLVLQIRFALASRTVTMVFRSVVPESATKGLLVGEGGPVSVGASGTLVLTTKVRSAGPLWLVARSISTAISM